MKFKQTAVLSSVVAGDAIPTNEAGFLPGMKVGAFVASPAGNFAGSAILQTSVDGTNWDTAGGAEAVTGAGSVMQVITLKQFVRLNMTSRSAGGLQATLISDVG